MREKDTQIKRKTIHYAVTGEGPSIVFVHGWSNNWMGWIPLIEQLKEGYTVYAIDQMGFGKSDRLKRYSIEVQADYLAEFIKKLPQKPILLCGLSLGTFVVSDCVLRYPGIVKTATLIGAVLPTNRRKKIANKILGKSLGSIQGHDRTEKIIKKIFEQRLTAYIFSKYINMYKFNRFLVDAYGQIGRKQMSKEAFVQMGISASKYDLTKSINSLVTPTLLVFGAADKFTKLKDAKKLLTKKDLQFAEIPESGHITSLEKPHNVASAIREFLHMLYLK